MSNVRRKTRVETIRKPRCTMRGAIFHLLCHSSLISELAIFTLLKTFTMSKREKSIAILVTNSKHAMEFYVRKR